MKRYILDENGEPREATTLEFCAFYAGENDKKRIVRQDRLGPAERFLVSTVFLGVDHDFSGKGPPVLWETMIFDQEASTLDQRQWRYTSRADAEQGHAAAVLRVRTFLAEDVDDGEGGPP